MVHRVRKLQKSRKGAHVRAQLGKMRLEIEESKYGGTDAERKTWADDVQAVLVAHREIAAIPDLAAYERVATTARDTYRRLFGSKEQIVRWAAKTIPHVLGKRYVALLPAVDP